MNSAFAFCMGLASMSIFLINIAMWSILVKLGDILEELRKKNKEV